ncbi:hypothetical protein AMK59_8279 [Oryctes borbonicus]|uniref:Uncharacterized protein n=1 Tax=Oryctes borbonicus TaxID=1629725 RepID=A0A0T6AVJ6_9SCAR|nr:hypothetical protein AMK59_8279 [Oryctes borbonicus]
MSVLPKSPYERAKKYNRFGKCSIDDLRREIRNEFKKRLKDYRNASVDEKRDSLEVSRIVQQGYKEIKASLLSDDEAVEFLDQNNLFSLLTDVQEEVLNEELQQRADDHEKEIEEEINAIVDNSISTCTICDKVIGTFESGIICEICVKHFDGEV